MSRRLQNRPLRVRQLGHVVSPWQDIYHRLLRLTWPRFFLLMFLAYLLMNFCFALLYSMAPGAIANVKEGDFLSDFAFSVQTFSTIGYGYFYPQTPFAHVLVTVEAASGLFASALVTGLVFAKFSRPAARIVFSKNILWTLQNGNPVLSLRLGNTRTNQVFDGRANMTLLRDEITAEGEKIRRMVDLKLVREKTPLFILSWTLFHPIDKSSPFFGKTPEEIEALGWDVFVTFRGHDQDVGQTITAHTTYTGQHMRRAKKFVDIIQTEEATRLRIIDFTKLHDVES